MLPTVAAAAREESIGAIVENGTVAIFSATKFVHAKAEYPREPRGVANPCQPKASSASAASVGTVAYARTGMAAKFDTMDNVEREPNATSETGMVATVAERVAESVSRSEKPFGTERRFSEVRAASVAIPSVAENERRNEASMTIPGSWSAIAVPTASRSATGSVRKNGSASTATLAIMAARITGMPLPVSAAYAQMPERSAPIRNAFGSRFAKNASMPATTATLPPLATTRCESPLRRYARLSSSDIAVPSPKRTPRAKADSFRG